MTAAADTQKLEELLAAAPDVATRGLRERLQWLEDAAAAAEQAELGDEGAAGALHLRAALGAFVRFSQADAATHNDPRAIAELDALVRMLLARGTLALYRALADHYDDLVHERAPHRAACAEVRDAFREAARAVERGEAVSAATRARLASARASLG